MSVRFASGHVVFVPGSRFAIPGHANDSTVLVALREQSLVSAVGIARTVCTNSTVTVVLEAPLPRNR